MGQQNFASTSGLIVQIWVKVRDGGENDGAEKKRRNSAKGGNAYSKRRRRWISEKKMNIDESGEGVSFSHSRKRGNGGRYFRALLKRFRGSREGEHGIRNFSMGGKRLAVEALFFMSAIRPKFKGQGRRRTGQMAQREQRNWNYW